METNQINRTSDSISRNDLSWGVVLGSISFSLASVIGAMIPANYFVILYCAVYLISPFFNVMIEKLTVRGFRNLVIISVCLFSAYPTLVDVLGEIRGSQFVGLSTVGMYGSQWGYSVVNFLLMYLIGAYLKKGEAKLLKWKTGKIAICLAVDIILIITWARVNDAVGFLTERSAWEYCNPLVILEAVLMFVLFTRINPGVNKTINRLAEGGFTVFLLHNIFLSFLQIQKFVTGNAFVMLLHIFISVVIIYLICWVVYIIYIKITEPIFRVLSNMIRLPLIEVES